MAKTIGGLFGRSAFGPLHEQAIKVNRCVQKIPALLDAWENDDRERIRRVSAEIRELENQADDIKDEMRASLSTSIFGAMTNVEVRLAIKRLDSVADRCVAASKLLEVRRTICPAPAHRHFRELGAEVSRLGEALQRITGAMYEAETAGSDPARAQNVTALLEEVEAREERTDQISHTLFQTLFDNERSSDPISVIMVFHIAQELERIADESENAADVLQRLAAHQ